MFPLEEQGAARERLADCLRGIVCQRLLKRKKIRGRVLSTEVLVNNYSVRECIRDPSRVKGLTQLLERSRDQGMHSMDQDLVALAREGLIEAETALAFASSQTDVRRALSGIGT
jgi:Tfp pilus assembly pilus retraction ATPase PilT